MRKTLDAEITIDGRHLSYPYTGLYLTTAELIRAFLKLGHAYPVSVFVANSFDPSIYQLSDSQIRWININYNKRKTDYLDRRSWAGAVTGKLKSLKTKSRHFIPYLYNYGEFRRNVVFIPDLVYRIYPDYGFRDFNQPWWNLRGRLPLRPIARRYEEWAVKKAEHLVVSSNFVRSHVQKELGLSSERMTVIPWAAPTWVKSAYRQENNERLRASFKLPQRFVLYIGGFAVRKNIPMLLRACARVLKLDSSFRCVLVGLTEQGIQNNPMIRSALSNHLVEESIIKLPKLPYAELASLYRLAEFTVYPSINEGFGLPILEAAAAKRLCLCGNNSSMMEIQTNAQYRIDSSDEDAWVRKILHFWQNPGAAKAAGEESERLCERYSWQQSAERLWSLLHS